jgi:hypothetical protein
LKFFCQVCQAFARPAERRFRLATLGRLDNPVNRGDELTLGMLQGVSSATGLALTAA